MGSTSGSSASTQFWELIKQELRLKRKAAERAFEAQAEKDRTLMRLEELRGWHGLQELIAPQFLLCLYQRALARLVPPPKNPWAHWRDFVDKRSRVRVSSLVTPVGAPRVAGAIPCGVDNDLHNHIFLSLLVVGDWVTAILSLAAASSSAGVMVVFIKDTDICRVQPTLSCNTFQISIALAFVAWFLLAISSYVMFWLLATI
nr:CASP-like protein 5B1 [Tanacetum cinerariifolium]